MDASESDRRTKTGTKMIDCIITTTSKHQQRRDYLFPLVKESLKLAGFNPSVLIDYDAMQRYRAAEVSAVSDFYILTDDDCIVHDPHDIWMAIAMMKSNPKIGILGFAWKKGLTSDELGSWYLGHMQVDQPEITVSLYEMDHVGGFKIIRKGIIDFDKLQEPDYNPTGDDMVICKAIRDAGYKVCLAPEFLFSHLGEGQSTIWNRKKTKI